MPEARPDRKADSILALKNANKHLAELFDLLSDKDSVLSDVSAQLLKIASQCGDLKVLVFFDNKWQDASMKEMLNHLATKLNEART